VEVIAFMNSYHRLFAKDASNMSDIPDKTVDLVVTSPPYPMIKMWDEIFSDDENVKQALKQGDGKQAFELMHRKLDRVWKELSRVVKDGGIVCINIGDATRTINGEFEIYMNHAMIISAMNRLGFNSLPSIIWRKQTNAPNKFMGSGMLPPGAYVTLEHEYVLIFRKGSKRQFKTKQDKNLREESSYFWEERNLWFSDLWDFKGISQKLKCNSRSRSAAFPYELAYRLINMYSIKGDIVLDPFLGTGTTAIAALASERNSIGYEIDESIIKVIKENICRSLDEVNKRILSRIIEHEKFIKSYSKPVKYFNENIKMPVVTSQERNIKFRMVNEINRIDDYNFECRYGDIDISKVIKHHIN
jgi:DNA modification methylase